MTVSAFVNALGMYSMTGSTLYDAEQISKSKSGISSQKSFTLTLTKKKIYSIQTNFERASTLCFCTGFRFLLKHENLSPFLWICTLSPSYFISACIPFGHLFTQSSKDFAALHIIGFTGVMRCIPTDILLVNFGFFAFPGLESSGPLSEALSTTALKLFEFFQANEEQKTKINKTNGKKTTCNKKNEFAQRGNKGKSNKKKKKRLQ